MEELKEQVIDANIEEYWESGGMLNRDGFEKAVSVLSGQANEEKHRVSNNSLAQVENMARFSKVHITPEQKYLYAVLRGMTGETDRRPDSLPDRSGTMPPWRLDDRSLLAEVLRLTDETNLDPFMRAYPNIFKSLN